MRSQAEGRQGQEGHLRTARHLALSRADSPVARLPSSVNGVPSLCSQDPSIKLGAGTAGHEGSRMWLCMCQMEKNSSRHLWLFKGLLLPSTPARPPAAAAHPPLPVCTLQASNSHFVPQHQDQKH